MDGVGRLAGWRWIFVRFLDVNLGSIYSDLHQQILEGLATIVVAVIAFAFLPRNLESASFLVSDYERVCICRSLAGLLVQ